MDVNTAKQHVIRAGKELIECGLIVRTWGNISCRIDKDNFVISPSGRAYDSLKLEDIVMCRVEDASYDGDIKPSSEKGIHALVYRTHADANFVIHTHQPQASAISAAGLNTMPATGFSTLSNSVPVGTYGLPGTKTLKNGVGNALKQTNGRAVIMSNHGAVCFGQDYDEALLAAQQLEDASSAFVHDTYMKASGAEVYAEKDLFEYYISLMTEQEAKLPDKPMQLLNSRRIDGGFILEGDEEIVCRFTDDNLPSKAMLHRAIYQDRKDINFIVQDTSNGLLPVSLTKVPLRPLLDDFAQIVGRFARCAKSLNPYHVVKALRGRSGVLIPGAGALCCASTQSDAHAVQLVMQKNAYAQIAAKIIGSSHYIGFIDCVLMHFVYTHSYAKKAKN